MHNYSTKNFDSLRNIAHYALPAYAIATYASVLLNTLKQVNALPSFVNSISITLMCLLYTAVICIASQRRQFVIAIVYALILIIAALWI
jgi:chromate transport protein ChrA